MSKFPSNYFKQQVGSPSTRYKEQITNGINRIRFIQNRTKQKSHRLKNVILSQRNQELEQKSQRYSREFVTTWHNDFFTKRPLSELRDHDFSESKIQILKQMNKSKVLQVREQKKNIKAVLQKNKQNELITNLLRRRKIEKQKQAGQFKKNEFKKKKFRIVIEFKQKCSEEKQLGLRKSEARLKSLEKRLIFAEKFKQLILERFGENQVQKAKLPSQFQGSS